MNLDPARAVTTAVFSFLRSGIWGMALSGIQLQPCLSFPPGYGENTHQITILLDTLSLPHTVPLNTWIGNCPQLLLGLPQLLTGLQIALLSLHQRFSSCTLSLQGLQATGNPLGSKLSKLQTP